MNDIQLIYDTLKAGGPVAISVLLFWMYREERKEKKELRDHLNDVQEKLLTNMVSQVQATSKLESSVGKLTDLLTQVITRL